MIILQSATKVAQVQKTLYSYNAYGELILWRYQHKRPLYKLTVSLDSLRPNPITLSSSLASSRAGLRPASELLADWIA